MTDIIATTDSIIFQFEDSVTADGLFNENSDASLIYIPPSHTTSTKHRWAIVNAIGPDVKNIKIKDRVLISTGCWTTGFKINGRVYWKTDSNQLLAVDNNRK